jgi:nitroreductase
MSGIVFFKTNMLEKLVDFYVGEVGCGLWMNQEDCVIFRHGNLLFGFCRRNNVNLSGTITIFYGTRDEVDECYRKFTSIASAPPKFNDKYSIYHFFARDPEGRDIEFQTFEPPAKCYLSGDDLLLTRRSVRRFKPDEVPPDVLKPVFEICRFAPTSRNSQSYYFRLIRDKSMLVWLADTRGRSSAPIGGAPLAVAICSDPDISKRHIQDACIAAYHFMLTAWFHGLGTCWIAAMDRDEIKEKLGIPRKDYIATITPVGWPEKVSILPPERKVYSYFLRDELDV